MHAMLLMAGSPISHGDPGATAVGNASPFRMQEVLYSRSNLEAGLAEDAGDIDTIKARNLLEATKSIQELALQYPLAADSPVTGALQNLKAEEFVASALIYSLIAELNSHNGGDGMGLFSGISRYTMLLSRVAIATSSTANSLFQFYSRLLNELKIDEALYGLVDKLPYFFSLPRSVQLTTLKVLADNGHSIIEGIARPWYSLEKAAQKSKEKNSNSGPSLWGDSTTPESVCYNPVGKVMGSSILEAEAAIPVISANSLRNNIFRGPLFEHLLEELGFGSVEQLTTAKESLLADWVVMLFANGGNVLGGTTTPENSAGINAAIKATFPSLDLLSGCLPTHIMGDGKLSVSSHTLCVQANQFTSAYGYTSDVDAASLLQQITLTRATPAGMASSKEAGQMLFTYVAMKAGTKILVTLNFAPFTSDLTRGAAYYARQRWLQSGGEVGGRVGSGCGQMQCLEFVSLAGRYQADNADELADRYLAYVYKNRERLRDELVSGKLGWSKKLA